MSEWVQGVNWLAVGLGTAVSFLLGWAWYSPKLFGTAWANGVGIDLSKGEAPPPMAMVTQLLGTFLLAWVVAIAALSQALSSLILVVIAFMCLSLSQGLFVKKSFTSMLIEQGYIAVMTVVMVTVHVLL